MAERGKQIALVIGIYLVAKSVLNLILGGFSLGNIVTLALMTGLAVILNVRVKYANIIVGVVSMLIVALYLPGNISGLPGTRLYLAEALLDIGAAVFLFVSPDVKAFLNS